MVLEITQIGNPVLRDVAEEVTTSDLATDKIQQFIHDLVETKRAANGAGLAAPQVGVSKRIFVVEVMDNPRYPYKPNVPLTVVVNPKITFLTEERFENYEGCLSVPDLRGRLDRCPRIRVEGLDRDGQTLDMLVNGVTAGTFQHEDDHLNGIFFLDRVTDKSSFSTWAEFDKRYLDEVRKSASAVIEKYGS
jgi:peptide deformylase